MLRRPLLRSRSLMRDRELSLTQLVGLWRFLCKGGIGTTRLVLKFPRRSELHHQRQKAVAGSMYVRFSALHCKHSYRFFMPLHFFVFLWLSSYVTFECLDYGFFFIVQ
jgi:hypothetical protein